MNAAHDRTARIHVGIGGWNYAPWRDNFYPAGWPQSRELEYASSKLGAIEINSTYYSSQKPSTFARWRDETPEGFVFSLKASRFATNRRVLAEAGESVARFVHGGIAELGPKLGPIVWQFAPTKRFDAADFGAFLELLPAEVDGIALRHAMDVRHASFMSTEYLALARRHRVATVFTDSDDYPSFADLTGDFVYVRTMRTDPTLAEGCTAQALAQLAACARAWRRSNAERAARGVPVLHQRRQGKGAGGGDGLVAAPGLSATTARRPDQPSSTTISR
jgi:uncharacterized protein YecE (DUF72 family)